MSPISPSDANLAMMQMDQQDAIQKRLDMDRLRERLNGQPDKKAKLREACEGFESVFIQKMWEQMRKNVQHSSYLHSRDEHMYQAMYDGEFSKKMTQAGGIGLADMLYDQLSQRLGESSRTTSTHNNPRLPIIPASSAVSAIGTPIKSLDGADGRPGMELGNNNVRPLYEDAPAHVLARSAVTREASPEAATAEDAAPEAAAVAAPAPAPALAPYDEDLDLEEMSHALLKEERESGGDASVPQASDLSLRPEDEVLIEAALRQSMADAGRITEAQAPVASATRFGTPLATDMADPADSAAGYHINNLSRS